MSGNFEVYFQVCCILPHNKKSKQKNYNSNCWDVVMSDAAWIFSGECIALMALLVMFTSKKSEIISTKIKAFFQLPFL